MANNQAFKIKNGLSAKRYLQSSTAVSASDVDLSTGSYFTKTLSANTTFTFSNPPASGKAMGFALEVTGGSIGPADIFSTYLYTGTGSNHYLAMDDVDVYNEGGMYWSKGRSAGSSLGDGRHFIVSKESLGSSEIAFYDDATSSTAGASIVSEGTWMQSDGTQYISGGGINTSGTTYVSWTFRKAPKFFDVVTYTGNDTAGRTVSHNLGCEVGMIIVKATNTTGNWWVYHRSAGGTVSGTTKAGEIFFQLEGTNAANDNIGWWNNTDATSTDFTLGSGPTNTSGVTYVAYLFAHDTSDSGSIQCGSYTGTASTNAPIVNLGWEPQWLLVKDATVASGWFLLDNKRGFVEGTNGNVFLYPNTTDFENLASNIIKPLSTGFQLISSSSGLNISGDEYIYIAIRNPSAVTTTWPSSVKWSNATSPDAPASGEKDLYAFLTTDGGINYYAKQIGDSV